MKYSRFETLILALGGAVIVGSMFVPGSALLPREVFAQFLIVVVLFAAAHWGRNGGFVAAVAATMVYVIIRIPLMNEQGLTSPVVGMIVTRTVTYGVVGIVGGEVCGRIKYFLARIQGSSLVDDSTQVYNSVFCGQALRSGISEFRRYNTPLSIVLLNLSPTLFADLRPGRQRNLLRTAASHMRNDVRLVDDVGYLGDGEFMLILPHTPQEGANVAADRVKNNVRDLLGAKDTSVTTRVLSLPEDAEAMCDLSRRLDPPATAHPNDPCETGIAADQAEATSGA